MGSPGNLEEVLAKLEIREALARYARGIDRYDIELAKSAYHPDATDEHGPYRGNAHEVMDRVERGMAGIEACQHQILNTLIELDGERANVESYFFSLHVPKGSKVEEHSYGRYIDVFERRDGEWKILDRRVVVDITSCPPRAPWKYEDRFSRGTRDRQDPSYGILRR
ncbi:MAG: nuclear transport factor 2 family protein [Gammaproteobacteria bacterium]|nr:nuclear transport factor 2 family protein [Gammaproteobacteria bacterium]